MTRYIIVEWPESQRFMIMPDFNDHTYLINDEKGVEIHGSSAYFMDEEWVKKIEPLLKKEHEDMRFYKVKKLGEDILAIVSEVMKVSQEELKSTSRKQWIVMAREIFCHYAREMGMSLTHIGRTINKHHASVIHLLESYNRDLSLSLFSLASDNVEFKINDYKNETGFKGKDYCYS